MSEKENVCTPESPWTPEKGWGTAHMEAVETESRDGKRYRFRCPVCKLIYRGAELQ